MIYCFQFCIFIMNIIFRKTAPRPIFDTFFCKFPPWSQQTSVLITRAKNKKSFLGSTLEKNARDNRKIKDHWKKKQLPMTATIHSSTKNEDTNVAASTGAGTDSQLPFVESWDVDFNDFENAYKHKSTFELLRALLVFNLCSSSYLVSNGLKLSHAMEKTLGKPLFKKLMKMSFYGHFVAGENPKEVSQTIDRLRKHGVGAIMDYAVEEDLSEEKAKDLEMDSCQPEFPDIEHPANKFLEKYLTRFQPHRQFGDRRQKVVSARTYFYEGEAKCDENMKIFLKCIEAAGKAGDGFAAVKLTALGRPQFLVGYHIAHAILIPDLPFEEALMKIGFIEEMRTMRGNKELQFSEVLIKGRQLFETFSGRQEGALVDKKFDYSRFKNKAERMGILMSRDDSRRWFTFMDQNESGFVDLLNWNELIAKSRRFSDLFQVLNPVTGQLERLLPNLSYEEEEQMKRMFQRVNLLAQEAQKTNVRLMIDAEQTYFQPAVSRITMEMMRIFNKEKTVVMNTYQCYLKETYNNLTMDLALAERENFYFGLKLVRGAYMEHERERAAQLAYEDPVQPTYEETNRNYNDMLSLLLKRIRQENKIEVMFATHNENSVKYALRKIHDYALPPELESQVYFGQLLGMCDYITFPLGHHGHNVLKYVPFGPVGEVLPYLHRRAQENRSVLSASKKERKMLLRELGRRFRGSVSFSRQ